MGTTSLERLRAGTGLRYALLDNYSHRGPGSGVLRGVELEPHRRGDRQDQPAVRAHEQYETITHGFASLFRTRSVAARYPRARLGDHGDGGGRGRALRLP